MAQDPFDPDQDTLTYPHRSARSGKAPATPPGQSAADEKLIDKDDFLLHEYDSLRTEILQGISTRYTIITITLTAFGASFVIQNTILPLLFPALALVMMNIYIANSYSTRRAADFIKKHIESQVTENGKYPIGAVHLPNIGWQTHTDGNQSEKELSNRYSAGKAIFFVSSLAASIAGTLFNSQASSSARVWPGFIVISFLISAFLAIPVFVSNETLVKLFVGRPSDEALTRPLEEMLTRKKP